MARVPRPLSMEGRDRARRLVRKLNAMYPEARCSLEFRSAFELLVATILSAQCTDIRVNKVTPALFERFPDPRSMALANVSDLETLIHSAGFFRAKARNLVAMARHLVEHHDGEVPADLEALTALPGVGRKTAHVVLGNAFAIPSGVVVDTHVKRLAFRLGLTARTDPETIEHELAAMIPKDQWVAFSHRLIAHGRLVCVAIRPRCGECELGGLCPKVGVDPRYHRTTTAP